MELFIKVELVILSLEVNILVAVVNVPKGWEVVIENSGVEDTAVVPGYRIEIVQLDADKGVEEVGEELLDMFECNDPELEDKLEPAAVEVT